MPSSQFCCVLKEKSILKKINTEQVLPMNPSVWPSCMLGGQDVLQGEGGMASAVCPRARYFGLVFLSDFLHIEHQLEAPGSQVL